ncbi:helix-turn-helix domain-containing protein [Polynucleobacter sp. CS-Odin-A6]|uniref:helix-turn-helix domain-containing protein n=1 Tax=Polynucleobacter sp. CS-Odin-A6 TaxID=2689106 RepID=UPI001C0CC190|nr:helix-turn-helix domain-containing protein [Polynucleobacter sp. CS-Odin-A6]MBU3620925.1 helix-turn-helix domain-containing protein [Polynucleobacter sp. CS-Odin-A6]
MELPEVVITEEFAKAVHNSPQTVRKNYCEKGHCYGIVPIKVGGRLLWRVSDIAKLLENGEAALLELINDESRTQKATA